jgi:DNA polymerase III delta prime subunit
LAVSEPHGTSIADPRLAIFLNGPVGVGKSTLGTALADALRGSFVEGDDHAPSNKAWYASTHSTAHSILAAILRAVPAGKPVVVAYPIRCLDWIFYRRKLADYGIRSVFVSLTASFEAITAADRGRPFSEDEYHRIAQMISEGYDRRPFSDFIVRTDDGPIDEVLDQLTSGLENHLTAFGSKRQQ